MWITTNFGKFFKRWEYQTTSPAPCKTSMQVKKQQLEYQLATRQNNGLAPIGKGVHKGCILSSCLFNLYTECTMQNAGLDEAQSGIKIARRNINKLRYADDTTLMAEPVHPKGDQSWVFIGRTNIEAETPILWPPHVKSWLIGKDPDAGKDWGQEKETTEDEMFRWHHWLNGHGFWQTQVAGDGQGDLACCGS